MIMCIPKAKSLAPLASAQGPDTSWTTLGCPCWNCCRQLVLQQAPLKSPRPQQRSRHPRAAPDHGWALCCDLCHNGLLPACLQAGSWQCCPILACISVECSDAGTGLRPARLFGHAERGAGLMALRDFQKHQTQAVLPTAKC